MLDKSLKPDFEPNNFFNSNREERLLLIKSSFVRFFFITVIWYLFFVLYSARFEEKPGFTPIIIWFIGIYAVLELVVLLLKLSNLNSEDNNSEIINLLTTEQKNLFPTSEQEQTESDREKVK